MSSAIGPVGIFLMSVIKIFHFQYAAQVITTNITKQRGDRFNTGRCIFLPKMCNAYEVGLIKLFWDVSELCLQAPESSLKAYEDSYQCGASIYTVGKVK